VRVRTDDEVYRVDAVWLGPPKATFPWRARYVAWGVGILVFLVTLTVEREIGFGFGFFTVAWALVITIVITRFLGSKISHERPLGAVLAMWTRELNSPREQNTGRGGAASATRIRVHANRPRPKQPARQSTRRPQQPQMQEPPQVPMIQMPPPGRARPSGGARRTHQHGRGRSARIRSKEVGGVRTPGKA
jgi:hypothetical protein